MKQRKVKKLTTTASAAVVLNRDTGQLVGTKNGTQPLAIASISKLMTGYLTLEKLAMTDMIKPSANTVKIGEEPELAAVPLTLEPLIGLVIYSMQPCNYLLMMPRLP